jgi:hypothetical protein
MGDEELEPEIPEPDRYGLQDHLWDDERWHRLLETLITEGFFTWKDVAVLALGQSNPPQVGTSIASNKNFQQNHREEGGRSVMQQVYDWLYEQTGRCADCGSRLDLQADHIDPRQDAIEDPAEVDRLENLTLRCRRHNVIRRRSHKLGGKTHLTAEAALMWILLVIRPRTYEDFARLCRLYGMTMADVRFREAWAMALWLEREGLYEIDDREQQDYLILLWHDGSLTRQRLTDAPLPADANVISTVSNARDAVFITRTALNGRTRYAVHRVPVRGLPFSTYDLGERSPTDLVVLARQPKADDDGNLLALPVMPPRNMELASDVIFVNHDQEVAASWTTQRGETKNVVASGYSRKVVDDPPSEVWLEVSS